jgi:hypothetical protein
MPQRKRKCPLSFVSFATYMHTTGSKYEWFCCPYNFAAISQFYNFAAISQFYNFTSWRVFFTFTHCNVHKRKLKHLTFLRSQPSTRKLGTHLTTRSIFFEMYKNNNWVKNFLLFLRQRSDLWRRVVGVRVRGREADCWRPRGRIAAWKSKTDKCGWVGSRCGSAVKWWKWKNKWNWEDPGLLTTPGKLFF